MSCLLSILSAYMIPCTLGFVFILLCDYRFIASLFTHQYGCIDVRLTRLLNITDLLTYLCNNNNDDNNNNQ